MIPGRVIRISDKVTLRLWPILEGQVIRSTPFFSLKLKPMTVSPYYPNLHPSELAPAIQQVVITIPPLPKATKDDQEGYQQGDDDDDQEDHQDHDEEDDEEDVEEDDEEDVEEDDEEDVEEDDNDDEEDVVNIGSNSSEDQDDNSSECPHPTGDLEDIKD